MLAAGRGANLNLEAASSRSCSSTSAIHDLHVTQAAGGHLGLSLGWCVVLSVGGFLWARTPYTRRSIR